MPTDTKEGPGVCQVEGEEHGTTTHWGWSVVCMGTRGSAGGERERQRLEGGEVNERAVRFTRWSCRSHCYSHLIGEETEACFLVFLFQDFSSHLVLCKP